MLIEPDSVIAAYSEDSSVYQPFSLKFFSRASLDSTRNSLIFLHPPAAVQPAASDNAQKSGGSAVRLPGLPLLEVITMVLHAIIINGMGWGDYLSVQRVGFRLRLDPVDSADLMEP